MRGSFLAAEKYLLIITDESFFQLCYDGEVEVNQDYFRRLYVKRRLYQSK